MVVSLGLNFALRIVLARALRPTELGLLMTAQGVVALGQSLSELNLPDAVARFVAVWSPLGEDRARGAFRSGIRLTLVASAIVSVILVAGSGAISRGFYRQPTLRAVLLVLTAVVPLVALANLLAGAARGRGQAWVRVICVDITRAAASIVLVVGLVVFGANGLLSVALTLAAAAVLAFLVTAIVSWRDSWLHGPAEGAPGAELMTFSLPLFGSSLTAWPLQLIPLWLGRSVGPQVVPYFSLSQALSNLLYMPVIAIDSATLPLWGQLLGSGRKDDLREIYSIASRWCFLLGCLVFVVLAVSPGAVLSLLYGPAYVPAAPVLRVTACWFMFNVMTGPNASLLSSLGLTHLMFAANVVGGVVSVVIGYPLISRWGISGALTTYLLANVANVGMCMVFLYRRERIQPFDGAYLKSTVLAGVAMVAAATTRPQALPPLLEVLWVSGVWVGIMGVGLLALGLIGERERRLRITLMSGVAAAYRQKTRK